MIQGMSEAHARRIERARAARPFGSVDDFSRRTGLSRSVAVRLAKAGAFGSLGLQRRQALWHALAQSQEELPLFDELDLSSVHETHRSEAKGTVNDSTLRCTHPPEAGSEAEHQAVCEGHPAEINLPKMSAAEEVLADYRTTGLSLSAHPLEFLRQGLSRLGVVPAAQLKSLPNGKAVRVAGIVLVRQRPGTAKGITFVTLEDETGTANLIIRPGVWKRWRSAALGATILLAHGRLQRHGLVIHVLTTKLENLSDRLKDLGPQSRDFC